jgi:AcrR family transcriptional regulator
MGRPREFDIEKAVETATELFWRNGYDGTPLSVLTEALGVTPPSFYLAFGSKEGLFNKVLERYQVGHLNYFVEALRQPTAREVVESLLYGFADAHTHPEHASGCLGINCGLPCPEDADKVRRSLFDLRKAGQNRLRERFDRAIAEGDLPAGSDSDALARLTLSLGWGMAVEAQTGATRADLHNAVALALSSWKGLPAKRKGGRRADAKAKQ